MELNRRLEANNPMYPHLIEPPPRVAVSEFPLFFDTRNQAWRIHDSSQPEAYNPDWPIDEPPRQKSEISCNLLELYDRIEKTILFYQMEFTIDRSRKNSIRMPYQLIPPQIGWKLLNVTAGEEYTVKAVYFLVDQPETFAGTITLTGGLPSMGDKLEWIDPFGVRDGVVKVVRLMTEDRAADLMEPRTGSGDMQTSKVAPFTPVVTRHLRRIQPGSVGDSPFGKMKQLKPMVRETRVDPMEPREVVEVSGWWLDHLIEFKCCAISVPEADRMSAWLRNFFILYTKVLKILGVQEMLFWEELSDEIKGNTTQNLYIRPVQYWFRLEELFVRRISRIRNFDIVTRILGPDSTILGETSIEHPSRWDRTHDSSGNYVPGSSSIGDDY